MRSRVCVAPPPVIAKALPEGDRASFFCANPSRRRGGAAGGAGGGGARPPAAEGGGGGRGNPVSLTLFCACVYAFSF
eukprot:COSAG06_NODE_48197_length_334_cov_0.446809_1_plen_76_part_01